MAATRRWRPWSPSTVRTARCGADAVRWDRTTPEGAALGLRRIAREVGCSTTVLYTRFGGKAGVVEALWREGFDRLWQVEVAAEAAASGDPAARLAALGQAYWRHALANPDYYRVMFGGAIPGFHPSAETLGHSRRTFGVVVAAVRDGIAAGHFRPEEPELIAAAFWAASHGVVSLALAGQFAEPEPKAIYGRALAAMADGFRVPAGAAGA